MSTRGTDIREADEVAPLVIGARQVGPGQPAYLIAELSGNHQQQLDTALLLIDLAAEAGCDAVKIQTYRPETMTIESDRPEFQISGGTPWDGQQLFELYGQAFTPWEWTGDLKERAEKLGIDLFSTPFDSMAVELLEHHEVPAYKIASFEIVDLALIRRVAATRKPMIISTGMATVGEIDDAVAAAREAGAREIALLHCNSAYPAPVDEMNLRTIKHLADGWRVVSGLSDHTLGTAASVAAVALGARIIEKHFIDSRERGGPDAAFSMEPHEFRRLVDDVRQTEAALGTVHYGATPREAPSLVFRRSLFVVESMEQGELFTERTVRAIRPGHGLAPKFLPEVLGRTAGRPIERGTPLTWDLLSG